MLQSSAIKISGLYTQTDPIPLLGISVSAEVRDFASRVFVQQTFKNSEPHPIEAVYVFPLEEGAAVCDFSVQIGDRIIRGEVEERNKAFEQYDEALSEGHGGFLLDQEKPNIFVASVGNLNPGQEAVVTITYVAELPFVDDAIRLMIPTTVSPRYAPPGSDPVSVDVISPPVSRNVPYGLSLRVKIMQSSPIRDVSSPSHEISSVKGEKECIAELQSNDNKLDRDFILEIKLDGPALPTALFQEHENGDRAIMVRFYPEFETDAKPFPSEIIFVLDCSGSMSGSSINQAKKVLELCLRSMSEGDRFNIVCFGNTFKTIFNNPRTYTEQSFNDAMRYIRTVNADLGGTELFPALEYVFERIGGSSDHRSEVLIMTDGEVFNEEKVINLARSNRHKARIFSFGIGYASSESLVRGLARVTGGVAEFVSPDEGIEAKVLRQFSRLDTPHVTDVVVDWGGMKVEQAPREFPPIFSGDSFTVYGRSKEGEMPERIHVSAKLTGGNISWDVPVQEIEMNNLVPTLWAKNYIRDLDTDSAASKGSRQTHRKQGAIKARLVEIAKRYNIASSETSFVAVEERNDEEKTKTEPVYRRIPIQLTRDWHGLKSRIDAMEIILKSEISNLSESRPRESMYSANVCFSRVEKRRQERRKETMIHELLQMQSAAGYFELSRVLEKILGKSLSELRELAKKIKGLAGKADPEHALATGLTLLALKQGAQEYSDLWGRSARKAKNWLERNAKDATIDSLSLMNKLNEFSPQYKRWG